MVLIWGAGVWLLFVNAKTMPMIRITERNAPRIRINFLFFKKLILFFIAGFAIVLGGEEGEVKTADSLLGIMD
jgi:hypothetical protein